LWAGVAKLRRDTGGVMNRCKPIAGERVPETVLRPTRQSGLLTDPIKLVPCADGNQAAFHPAVRPQPLGELGLNRHNPAAGAFFLCCFNLNKRGSKIHFIPIEPFDFSVPQSSKRTDSKHWKDIRGNAMCSFQ